MFHAATTSTTSSRANILYAESRTADGTADVGKVAWAAACGASAAHHVAAQRPILRNSLRCNTRAVASRQDIARLIHSTRRVFLTFAYQFTNAMLAGRALERFAHGETTARAHIHTPCEQPSRQCGVHIAPALSAPQRGAHCSSIAAPRISWQCGRRHVSFALHVRLER